MDHRLLRQVQGFNPQEPMEGIVVEWVPAADVQPQYQHMTLTGHCWCEPEAWEVYDEDNTVAYVIIEHRFVH